MIGPDGTLIADNSGSSWRDFIYLEAIDSVDCHLGPYRARGGWRADHAEAIAIPATSSPPSGGLGRCPLVRALKKNKGERCHVCNRLHRAGRKCPVRPLYRWAIRDGKRVRLVGMRDVEPFGQRVPFGRFALTADAPEMRLPPAKFYYWEDDVYWPTDEKPISERRRRVTRYPGIAPGPRSYDRYPVVTVGGSVRLPDYDHEDRCRLMVGYPLRLPPPDRTEWPPCLACGAPTSEDQGSGRRLCKLCRPPVEIRPALERVPVEIRADGTDGKRLPFDPAIVAPGRQYIREPEECPCTPLAGVVPWLPLDGHPPYDWKELPERKPVAWPRTPEEVALWSEHLHLAAKVARKYQVSCQGHGMTSGEVEDAALDGLGLAVRGWDPARGKFEKRARAIMQQEIYRQMTRIRRGESKKEIYLRGFRDGDEHRRWMEALWAEWQGLSLVGNVIFLSRGQHPYCYVSRGEWERYYFEMLAELAAMGYDYRDVVEDWKDTLAPFRDPARRKTGGNDARTARALGISEEKLKRWYWEAVRALRERLTRRMGGEPDFYSAKTP
jgi:hypothetical protein